MHFHHGSNSLVAAEGSVPLMCESLGAHWMVMTFQCGSWGGNIKDGSNPSPLLFTCLDPAASPGYVGTAGAESHSPAMLCPPALAGMAGT